MNREYPSTSCTEDAKHSQIPFMNASANLALPLGNWWQDLAGGAMFNHKNSTLIQHHKAMI